MRTKGERDNNKNKKKKKKKREEKGGIRRKRSRRVDESGNSTSNSVRSQTSVMHHPSSQGMGHGPQRMFVISRREWRPASPFHLVNIKLRPRHQREFSSQNHRAELGERTNRTDDSPARGIPEAKPDTYVMVCAWLHRSIASSRMSSRAEHMW